MEIIALAFPLLLGYDTYDNTLDNTSKKKNKIKENIYSANDYEEVWKSYPNKRGKAKAIISIGKILKSIYIFFYFIFLFRCVI